MAKDETRLRVSFRFLSRFGYGSVPHFGSKILMAPVPVLFRFMFAAMSLCCKGRRFSRLHFLYIPAGNSFERFNFDLAVRIVNLEKCRYVYRALKMLGRTEEANFWNIQAKATNLS